ncbi:hypothetical protein BaRGS_00008130, partial [Batillaria attramentaria]
KTDTMGAVHFILFLSVFAATNGKSMKLAETPGPRLTINPFQDDGSSPRAAEEMDLQETKIVGGVAMEEFEWPFMVMLEIFLPKLQGFMQMCGGTILDELTVLTAAHCLYGFEQFEYRVRAGVYNQSVEGRFEQRRNVTERRLHLEYSGGSPYDNDIAILKLGSPLQLEDGVTEKVQLNRDSACPQDCAICTVGGWGRTTEGGIPSELPLKVDLPIVNSEECDVPYVEFVGPNSIGPGKVCAGEEVDGESACQGDSGGPVMSNCNGVMEQVGIVSYGIGCARAEYPNVYARVSYYTDWIKDNRV